MGLINHLYGCKFLCLHSSKLVLLEYHFLAGRPFAGVYLTWLGSVSYEGFPHIFFLVFLVLVYIYQFLLSKDTFNYELFSYYIMH